MQGSSALDNAFRPVPRTGVIYVMTEAAKRGFAYGNGAWSNLGQGAPETGPLPGAPDRITNVPLDEHTAEYAPVPGLGELRAAVAELYNRRYRRGMASQYTAENVAIAAGGRTGLTRIATALGTVNLGHLLPDYTAYEELLDVFRAFVPIPIVLHEDEGFRLSPSRLEREIVGAGLGAVLLSNPCNPTGCAITGSALSQWVATARRNGCVLILDEFYAHYVYDLDDSAAGRGISAAAYVEDVDTDPIVFVDGLTKNWRYPGWRLSWTVGPRSVIERVSSAGSFLDGGAPHFLQRAALPLLELDVAQAEAAAIQQRFGHKRRTMLERLEAMGVQVPCAPQGAFYCFAGLGGLPESLRDGMDFFRAALEHEVICVPGEFFDVNPGQRRSHIPSRLKGFVRLSFGPDLEQVERGLDRLSGMIASA